MPANSNTNKWIVIKFTLIGLCILTIFSWLVDFGVKRSDFSQTGKINMIAAHTLDPDIIIFGSSAGEVGINSSIIHEKTKLSAFNCSIDGTRFMQYKGLIDEFLLYSKNNKYVILVETYFSFDRINAVNALERYVSQINHDNIFNSLYNMQPDLVWKCRYIPFYKYVAVSHVYYKNAVIGWKNFISKSPRKDTANGYTPIDMNWDAAEEERIKNTEPFHIQPDKEIVQEYTNTVRALQQSGRKVIIMFTPAYKALNQLTDLSPMRLELKNIAASTGAKFLDFSNSEFCSQKEYFYNLNHLNVKGSSLFSEILADSLNAIIKKP